MPLFSQRNLAWYKRNDPQGAEGYYLDLMIELVFLLFGVGLLWGFFALVFCL